MNTNEVVVKEGLFTSEDLQDDQGMTLALRFAGVDEDVAFSKADEFFEAVKQGKTDITKAREFAQTVVAEAKAKKVKPEVPSENDVIEEDVRTEITNRQAQYRYQKGLEIQLKKKHSEAWLHHNEILLHRRELSSQDLKALVAFSEHFGLKFNVQENLGTSGYLDRKGLMISISNPTF